MMRIRIYIFLMLASLTVNAQSKGDQFRNQGDLEKAVIAYKTEMTDASKAKNATYNLACAYALMYQKDSSFHYLSIALKQDNSLWALADNDLISLTDDQRWESIEEQQIKKYQQVNSPLKKPEYAKLLLRLIMRDQALDYQIDMAKRYYMKNAKAPHWYYPLSEMKRKITQGNFANMERLIAKYGWPTYSSVGKLASDGPLLVINHHEKEEIRIKYLPRIKEACLKKQGSCMEYAKIQDRILVNTGKPQIYGMQFHYNSKRELVPFTIKDPEYVDQRRAKIGLEPLKKYLKRKINYDWTVPQKKR